MTSTRGIRNCNPLNIRRNNTVWQGLREVQTDNAFFQFKTMAYGYRAAFRTIRTYILNGYDTDGDGNPNELEDVIMRWAPPVENHTENYIMVVSAMSGIKRTDIIDWRNKDQMIRLVSAMSYMENGVRAVPSEVEEGWRLTGF